MKSSASGRWDTPPEYLAVFPKVRLLVLGSYAPEKLDTVKDISHQLIQNEGLSNARLVSDFATPEMRNMESEGAYNLRKSEFWIPNADVLLFVFLGQDAGVMHELDFALTTVQLAARSIVAYDRTAHVTSLLQGLIDRYTREVSEIPFDGGSLGNLCQQVAGNVAQIIPKIYWEILLRPPGGWECTTPQ
jgi:hypothetical protein